MWKDYISMFGPNDTYGFTFPNPSAQNVQWAIEVNFNKKCQLTNISLNKNYDLVGVRPSMYALDIYGNEETTLANAYQALVSNNEGQKFVLIQECYLNDVIAYEGFMQATLKYDIPLIGIFQWPLARSSNHTVITNNNESILILIFK